MHAFGHPFGGQIYVRGCRPRPDAREHRVLQHEMLRVRPVVRNVVRRLIAGHIMPGEAVGRAGAVFRFRRFRALHPLADGLDGDEAIHGGACNAVIEVELRALGVVVAAQLIIARIVEQCHTALVPVLQVQWQAGARRDAVGARIGPKIGIEGTIFLDDDDHVLNGSRGTGARGAGRAESCGNNEHGECRATNAASQFVSPTNALRAF